MSKWAVADTTYGYIVGLLVKQTAKKVVISGGSYDRHLDLSQLIALVEGEDEAAHIKARLEQSKQLERDEIVGSTRRHQERVTRIKLDHASPQERSAFLFGIKAGRVISDPATYWQPADPVLDIDAELGQAIAGKLKETHRP